MLLERELVWHTTVCDQGVENSHAKQYQELLHQWYFLTKPLENDPFIRVFSKILNAILNWINDIVNNGNVLSWVHLNHTKLQKNNYNPESFS